MKLNLFKAYEKYHKEIESLGFDNDIYSHPYYISLPDNWESAQARIMVVGEEGHGEKRINGSIEQIQKSLAEQFDYLINNSHSNFWKRFRALTNLGCCVWNNLDKVHRLSRYSCRLSNKERKLLHSTNTKILSKEIEILKPDIVIFFGWYGASIEMELPDVFKCLYPKGISNNVAWFDSKHFTVELDGTVYIFTYHPAWRRKPKDYENTILEIVKKHIKNLTD